MPRWNFRLEIAEIWQKAQADEAAPQEVAAVILRELRKLPPAMRSDEWNDLVDQFESLSEDEYADTQDFDCVMSDLYDWADEARVWVNTFDVRAKAT
jgi:hypothetical protein